jgi:hypothetical protein
VSLFKNLLSISRPGTIYKTGSGIPLVLDSGAFQFVKDYIDEGSKGIELFP